MGRVIFWGGWLRNYRWYWAEPYSWPSRCVRYTSPDQDQAPFIDCKLSCLDDFGLQVLQVRLVKIELPLQRPIGDPFMPL